MTGCQKTEPIEESTEIITAEYDIHRDDFTPYEDATGYEENINVPITVVKSNEAKSIIQKYCPDSKACVEGKDKTGKKTLVYNIYYYTGIDADGYYYTPDGELKGKCSHCGKTLGEGKNMCDGSCYITFEVGM